MIKTGLKRSIFWGQIALAISAVNWVIVSFLIVLISFNRSFDITKVSFLLAIVQHTCTIFILFLALRNTKILRREYLAWGLFALGEISNLIGIIVAAFNIIIFKGQSTQIQDFFYILFYPMMIAGLLFLPTAPTQRNERLKLNLDMIGVMVGSALIFWGFLFGPILEKGNSLTLDLTASLTFIAGDLALLWAVIAIMLRSPNARKYNPLPIMVLGFTVLIITDSIYGYQINNGTYQEISFLDMGFSFGTVLLAYAGLLQIKSQTLGEIEYRKRNQKRSKLSSLASYMPYLALAAAYFLLVWSHNHQLPIPYDAMFLGVGAIIAIIIVRQMIAFKENDRLFQEAQSEIAHRQEVEFELIQAKDLLEVRVQERTAELARVNAQIAAINEQLLETNQNLQAEVVERKQIQSDLVRAQNRLQHLLTSSPAVIYSCKVGGDFEATFISDNIDNQLGFSPDSFITDPRFWIEHIHPDDLPHVVERMKKLPEKKDLSHEYRFQNGNGEWRWLQDDLQVVRLDNNNYASEIVGALIDITDRKKMEEQISGSLREKEVLLKEIHHRVKNNLQIISSLLNLQSEKIQDAQIRQYFKESQNRIKSMALIHEKLYRSQDLSHIEMNEYLRSLVISLTRSSGDQIRGVKLLIDIPELLLNIEAAMPCGLIVNELVSNCFKHAFINMDPSLQPEISVSLNYLPETGYQLEVGDNGCGLQPGIDLQSTATLGLLLVNTLTRQLDGALEVQNSNGTLFRITFPEFE